MSGAAPTGTLAGALAVASPYRFFEVSIARVEELSPTFLRITFSGSDLDRFADVGTDQRIKIIVPLPGSGIDHLPMRSARWYDDWRALPEQHRNPLRTYTVRSVRVERHEIDVDVVRHDGGLASDWLSTAAVGDVTAVLGPNADHPGPYGGQTWNPPAPTSPVLVVGDETAVPAVVNICAALAPDAVGEVILEVPQPADVQQVSVPPGVRISWLARGDNPYGEAIRAAVDEILPRLCQGVRPEAEPNDDPAGPDRSGEDELLWEIPTGDSADQPGRRPYVWVAAETSTVRELRSTFLAAGARRSDLALMGYWRRGRSES